MRLSVKDLPLAELEEWFVTKGEKAFRSRQLFTWLYNKCVSDFESITNFNSALKLTLSDSFDIDEPVIENLQVSSDGAKKFLLRLRDGLAVESVIIPDEKRTTLCISTQVGCARGCRLCATASMGFKRNLSTGEILNQIIAAKRLLTKERISNIVYMGMGEPLDNLDAVLASIKVVVSEEAFCISPKRITVSTVGIIEGFERLAKEGGGVGLAVSLHAPNDEIRKTLIPHAYELDMDTLLKHAANYARITGEKITFEYVMIGGVNCSPSDAATLAKRLSRLPSKINLIPYNDSYRKSEFHPPTEKEVDLFMAPLLRSPVIVTVRKSRGRDIDAACGQLCVKVTK